MAPAVNSASVDVGRGGVPTRTVDESGAHDPAATLTLCGSCSYHLLLALFFLPSASVHDGKGRP